MHDRSSIPTPPAAVLLDLDGTLVDTEPVHWASTNDVLARFGAFIEEEDYTEFIGFSDTDFWRKLIARFALDAEASILADERTRAYVQRIKTTTVSPCPSARELLAFLRERNIPYAVASASPTEQIDAAVRAAGLTELLPLRFSGHDDVANSKPAPDVYLAAANALGVDAAKAVAIEDSSNGAKAARASGAFVIGVSGPSAPGTTPVESHLPLKDLAAALEALQRAWPLA